MTPASKEELYLAKLCGEDWKLPYPASRLEYYYAKLCGMNVPLPHEPLSRPELYLACLCGIAVVLPQPISRKEMYMAKACGMDVEKLPEPLSKAERYWAILVQNIRSVTGTPPLCVSNEASHLLDYEIYCDNAPLGIKKHSDNYTIDLIVRSINVLDNAVAYWEQGQIMKSGQRIDITTRIRTIDKFPISANTTYTLQKWGDIIPAFHLWRADGTYISDSTWITDFPYVFQTPTDAAWIEFTCRRTDNVSTIQPSVMDDTCFLQLETGNSPSAYTSYVRPIVTEICLGNTPLMIGETIRFLEQKRYCTDGTTKPLYLPSIPILSHVPTVIDLTAGENINLTVKYF